VRNSLKGGSVLGAFANGDAAPSEMRVCVVA
jgi:hypothetical protein